MLTAGRLVPASERLRSRGMSYWWFAVAGAGVSRGADGTAFEAGTDVVWVCRAGRSTGRARGGEYSQTLSGLPGMLTCARCATAYCFAGEASAA